MDATYFVAAINQCWFAIARQIDRLPPVFGQCPKP